MLDFNRKVLKLKYTRGKNNAGSGGRQRKFKSWLLRLAVVGPWTSLTSLCLNFHVVRGGQ